MESPASMKNNIHIGELMGTSPRAARFVEHFHELAPHIKERLTLENDDKTFTAQETLAVCKQTGRRWYWTFITSGSITMARLPGSCGRISFAPGRRRLRRPIRTGRAAPAQDSRIQSQEPCRYPRPCGWGGCRAIAGVLRNIAGLRRRWTS